MELKSFIKIYMNYFHNSRNSKTWLVNFLYCGRGDFQNIIMIISNKKSPHAKLLSKDDIC